jgi:hypothetical protein
VPYTVPDVRGFIFSTFLRSEHEAFDNSQSYRISFSNTSGAGSYREGVLVEIFLHNFSSCCSRASRLGDPQSSRLNRFTSNHSRARQYAGSTWRFHEDPAASQSCPELRWTANGLLIVDRAVQLIDDKTNYHSTRNVLVGRDFHRTK